MNKVKMYFYLTISLFCAMCVIMDAQAQKSQHNPDNGRENYYNPVPMEIAYGKGVIPFTPLSHIKGYEGGGVVAWFSLVDVQNQAPQRGLTEEEIELRKANQGAAVYASNDNILLAPFREYFGLKVFDEDSKLKRMTKEDMNASKENIVLPNGILLDTQMVSVIGFLHTHYPDDDEIRTEISKYKTEVASYFFSEMMQVVEDVKGLKKTAEGDLASNEKDILEIRIFEEEDGKSRRELRREVDSLEKVNSKLRDKIADAKALIAEYENKIENEIAPYVCVYEKNLWEFFAKGGVIFDGFEIVPEPLLYPEYATNIDRMIIRPMRPFGSKAGDTFTTADGSTWQVSANGECVKMGTTAGSSSVSVNGTTGTSLNTGTIYGQTANLTTNGQFQSTGNQSFDQQLQNSRNAFAQQKAAGAAASRNQQMSNPSYGLNTRSEIAASRNQSQFEVFLSRNESQWKIAASKFGL